ncbi:MAG: 6-phosphofructokinase [Oscillospiraceae bacterium]|nr:MAG: 6-phosphofructokinase [Oscillospiraceae bacterium]
MSKDRKTIGVLTSGGDAPGMNAAVRAVVRMGINRGFSVVGIRRGYAGLLANDMDDMNLRSVSDILQRGGTVLYSSRCPEFAEQRNIKKAVENCRKAGIDALVTIGGDGTFRGALDLCREGLPCIGLPGTIDNDISASDYTIGFDTAINTVVQMVDRVRDTSQSHDRCSVIEVMGRHAGHIALHSGIACGALAVLVPEIEFTIERDVVAKMVSSLRQGKQNFIVMVAEGVGHAPSIAEQIENLTGIETNAVVLGYVQRGGSPTAKERVLASQMGHRAVELIEQGIGKRVVVYRAGKVVDLDIEEALAMHKGIDMDLYRVANDISI